MKKVAPFKNALTFFTILFLVWGLYRLLFKLPDEVEEIIIKPLVWVVPVIFLVRRERATLESIGLTLKNLFPAIYMSLALGSVFVVEAVILNFLKYHQLNFGANLGNQTLMASLATSFATAFSEELVFRGYIFTRLWQSLNNEWTANLITSILWTLIHVPITILVNKLAPVDAVVYLFLTFVFGMGSAFIYGRTRNIGSSIFLHVLWEWPIMLFR